MDSEWNSSTSTNLTWDHKRFSRDFFFFLITNWPIRSLIVLQFSQPSPEPIVPSTCALGFPFIVFGFIGNFTSLWCHRSIARYRSDDVVNSFLWKVAQLRSSRSSKRALLIIAMFRSSSALNEARDQSECHAARPKNASFIRYSPRKAGDLQLTKKNHRSDPKPSSWRCNRAVGRRHIAIKAQSETANKRRFEMQIHERICVRKQFESSNEDVR